MIRRLIGAFGTIGALLSKSKSQLCKYSFISKIFSSVALNYNWNLERLSNFVIDTPNVSRINCRFPWIKIYL